MGLTVQLSRLFNKTTPFGISAVLAIILLAGCATTYVPQKTLLKPQEALSLFGDGGPPIHGRLGKIKIEPFSTALISAKVSAVVNSTRSLLSILNFEWEKEFRPIESSFNKGLRTLLETPILFGDSAEFVINVQAELLSIEEEEIVRGSLNLKVQTNVAVRYEFKIEGLDFSLTKEITSHGTQEVSAFSPYSNFAGKEKAFSQNLRKLASVLKDELLGELQKYYKEYSMLLKRAEEAEKNGDYRKAFRLYGEMSHPHSDIIKRIIKLYHKLDPPPAIPEEARKHAIFAATATKKAKDNSGNDRAIDENYTVIRLAPWWADPYINLALLLEKRGRFTEAIRALRLYLLASPDAPDVNTVQSKIYELEFKAESAKP